MYFIGIQIRATSRDSRFYQLIFRILSGLFRLPARKTAFVAATPRIAARNLRRDV
jgi:hypothetical protein